MTEFDTIYESFLRKIESFEYLKLEQEDAEKLFFAFLVTAITKFEYVCRKDLNNMSDIGFNEELSTMEQEILSMYMVIAHIDSKTVVDENFKNFLNSRDYRQYSTANTLRAVIELREMLTKEVEALKSQYDNMMFMREINPNKKGRRFL